MGFDQSITFKTVMGNKRVHTGKWAYTSISGGKLINTGLKSCAALFLSNHDVGLSDLLPISGGAVISGGQTFPVSGGQVQIITLDNSSGQWIAFGM